MNVGVFMENNDCVKEFYEKTFNEDEREARETLEFARSKRIIARYLSKSVNDIADIAGGAGAYSFWLAEMGFNVHLLDLTQKHINIATQKSHNTGIVLASCLCADARELPYNTESMDMALLMGALYHFQAKESRVKCLTEMFRVLRKNSIAICTVMNRYNYLISSLKYKHLIESMGFEFVKNALSTGIANNEKYTKLPLSYGHTPGEIISEMKEVGFSGIELIAVEGIANALGNNQLPEEESEAEQLLKCIELVESVPELIGVSRNIIAVGVK